MSINPGGPIEFTLAEWVENNVSAIYTATSSSSFDSAFSSLLLNDAHITVNGKHLTLAQYKQLLEGERQFEKSADVTFVDSVPVVTNPNAAINSQVGNVGVFFKVAITETVDNATRTVNSSLNATVVEDKSKSRKISALNQVVLASPVTLPN